MTVEVVGRDEEVARLTAFLKRAREGPAALLLDGEAGIGKTTLWLAAVEAATNRGIRVSSARPAEAERTLAHAGLGDLVDGADAVLPELPPPQRRALEVALLLRTPDGSPPDPRDIGVALRSVLERMTSEAPLLIAIDDVQWLDSSSAAALEFALRRIGERPILVLLARRTGTSGPIVEDALAPEQVERLSVGPISLGAVQKIVRERLGVALPRPTLVRLHEVSGGNPFFALELARAVERGHVFLDPKKPLPIPATLEALVGERLGELPARTRRALVAIAALGDSSRALAVSVGGDDATLAPALAEGIIEETTDGYRFTHPLLASVLYGGATPSQRRAVHRRVAKVLDDPVVRARHLALGSETPDESIARALDEAADLARTRGAVAAAAELGELAVRVTPPSRRDDQRRRTLLTARDHGAAGTKKRMGELGETLLASSRPGRERAEALALLGEVKLHEGDVEDALGLLDDALREARGHPAIEASIHLRVAFETQFAKGLDTAEPHARRSLVLAEQLGDDLMRSRALAVLAEIRFEAGAADARALAEQSIVLARKTGDIRALLDAEIGLADQLLWSGQIDDARALLEEARDLGYRHGEIPEGPLLFCSTVIELRAGRWEIAADDAERSHDIVLQYGEIAGKAAWVRVTALWPVAIVAAHQGRLDEARELCERALEIAETADIVVLVSEFGATLGLIDLWRGDAAAAVQRFAVVDEKRRAHEAEPRNIYRSCVPEHVEALLAVGRIDDAVEVLDTWEAEAVKLARPWELAHAVRCWGLIATAQGDVEEAIRLLDAAAAEHDEVGDPFGRGRALLALGVVHRRARSKRAARDALEAALTLFEDLGAAGWAEKARVELGSVGGRVREDGLTPAELRVARLAAGGQTNSEVAATLFLGERTVETHLTHVYAKLGIRSRTELARKLPS